MEDTGLPGTLLLVFTREIICDCAEPWVSGFYLLQQLALPSPIQSLGWKEFYAAIEIKSKAFTFAARQFH
jgi:hypothetical protein